MVETSTESKKHFLVSPYELTSSLIWLDRRSLIWLFLLLSIPPVIFNFALSSPESLVIPNLIRRLFEICFLFIIAHRWLNRASSSKQPITVQKVGYFAVFGLAYWVLIEFPRFALSVTTDSKLQMVFLILYIPAIHFALKYFFYFAPIIFGEYRFTKVLFLARHYTYNNLLLPIKTMVAPLGIMVLVKGAITAFSPDLRHLSALILSEVASSLFFFLCSYLSVGFFLAHALTPKLFGSFNLKPYYSNFIETINVNKKRWITTQINVKHGVFTLVVGAFLWTANSVQLLSLAPAPHIELVNAEAIDQRIFITLKLEDSKYHFRGFHPISFNLAGETRTTIAPPPVKAYIDSYSEDVRLQLPPGLSQALLQLEFVSDRKGKALTELKDLYLWYFNVKLFKIELK